MSARGELEEHHAEREHVAGACHGLAAGLLRRHVAGVPRIARTRVAAVSDSRVAAGCDESRQTEVENLHVTIGRTMMFSGLMSR